MCAFIIGIVVLILPITNIKKIEKFDNDVVINGVVCDYVDNEPTYTKFIVKDCVVVDGNNTHNLKYKVMVYTTVYTDVKLGDKVTFTSKLQEFKQNDDYELSMLGQGVGYSTYVSTKDLLIKSGSLSLKDAIHEEVKSVLRDNLNQDNADICFAILFGQKQGLSDNISNMFSYAGISHILAVSGLHIGVLVTIIWFAIDKLKINKYVKVALLSIILIFYCYLCSFSPSVLRASLMAIILALCRTFFWQYDSLSSLSLSGIIILLINPMSIFSISFQLSFMCIFAIISFAPSIKRLFQKIRFPKVFNESLSMSIAVNIAIIPICMNSFAEVSLLGVIANIFILPIFSVTYILLFVGVIIVLIVKPLGFILGLPNLFLHIIKVIASYIGMIPFGVFKVFRASYLLIFLFMLFALTIHYWMSKRWWKTVWVGVLAVVVTTMLVMYSIPANYKDNTYIINQQYNSNVIMYQYDKKVTMIGSSIELDTLKFIMKENKLKNIDTIIAYDLKLNEIEELISIQKEFNVNRILLPHIFEYEEINNQLKNIEYFNTKKNIGDMRIELIELKGQYIAIDLYTKYGEILVTNIENNNTENKYLRSLKGQDVSCVVMADTNVWEDMQNTIKIIDITQTDLYILSEGE